ncbi:ComEC/Rec2 family competence protein, partial [Candidatus Woesebacteria bacterium]|nr:ComEC/Rec2 family competence protein [Candidatus Woesebacteria bacterium]
IEGLKVYLPLYPEISYGDKVVVEGMVKNKKLDNAKLISLDKSQGLFSKTRERIITFYQKSLPEPHASLLAGITLGSRVGMSGNFWDSLVKTGLAHVVVASGSNVSLVGGFLVGVLTLLFSRKMVIPLILAGIWFYAVLAGFDAPIVRAAIMGSIAFSAQELGKIPSAWRALVLAALLMLFIKPQWIIDIGFILSFVATGSLLLFQARLGNFLKAVPGILREGLSTSLAAQIGVTPVLFVTFGQFNILSPLANALVLWTVPLIMAISGVSGIVGLLIPSFARLILYSAYPLTAWFIFVVRIFS